MLKKNEILLLDLQLFADGGSGAADGHGGEGAGATETAAVSQKGVKADSLANVKYGIQAEEAKAQAADVQTKITDGDGNTVQTVDRKAEFDKLIKGEYKDLYDSSVQNILTKRLANKNEYVDKYKALIPVLETLAKKYGVDATDPNALREAVENDDAYFEQEAMEKNLTVDQLKEFKKIERENSELKKLFDEQKNRQRFSAWAQQAEDAKRLYPSLDLNTEFQNAHFRELLNANVDVRSAYEICHRDEIFPAVMQYTAKTVEKKLTDSIKANGSRPTENGTSSQSASMVKSDVTKLSDADFEEIIRRVSRGDKISFG
jgi:hypothetical protein